jgi:hypothetical protein
MTNLVAALIEAQKEFHRATKNAENPYFGSDYLDLAGTWDCVRDALHSHGLTVLQYGEESPAGVAGLTTELIHVSGESRKGWLPIKAASISKQKKDDDVPREPTAQQFGGGITYTARYGLQRMLGICPLDDDGNEASGNQPAKQDHLPKKRSEPAAPARQFATDDQRRELMAALDALSAVKPDLGAGTKEEQKQARLWWIGTVIKRKILTTAELTTAEADACIAQAREES